MENVLCNFFQGFFFFFLVSALLNIKTGNLQLYSSSSLQLSPLTTVLDCVRTPSTDPLGFLNFCKASLLALKGKALMLVSRIY